MKLVDHILRKLADLIQQNRFEEVETDTLEIKTVPSTGGDWSERYKTACAFLNHRGGILLLGIKEEGRGPGRRYVFTGWQPHAEPQLKELHRQFTDGKNVRLDIDDRFPPFEIHPFMSGQLAVVYVDELSADRKYAFYDGNAYERIGTGDHKISAKKLEAQAEFKEEAVQARELQPVPDVTVADLDLDKLNEYITFLNRPTKVETIKAETPGSRTYCGSTANGRDAGSEWRPW